MTIRILTGDCREIMKDEGPFDLIIADPPYGDTSLAWDRRVEGWQQLAAERLKPTGSMWVFGSLRSFMESGPSFREAGFCYAQDVVWEKHNGSGFQADRFKRVHEHAAQLYQSDVPWKGVFNDVQVTMDAVRRSVPTKRTKGNPAQMGKIKPSAFFSEEGGPRIMRSVLQIPSCHGHAIHPTEKPIDLLLILIRTSCPPGGLVGDFFAGSGAAADACAASGRNYVGCEIDPVMAARAANRSLFVLGSAA